MKVHYRLVNTPGAFFEYRIDRWKGWLDSGLIFPHWSRVRGTDHPILFEEYVDRDFAALVPPPPPLPTTYIVKEA